MEERLQKIISAAGITSRRAAETLITEGRVRVNGTVVTELGTRADPSRDHIKVDGKLINPRQPMTYLMLNKPAGYVTTLSDPEGRPTVQNLLKGVKVRVYPVGRLDYNTEGMLLLTNDGDFAHLITHPKHELPKTYRAKIRGLLDDKQINDLEAGIYLEDGKTAPAHVKKVRKEEANSWVDITIHEGRKRQVRRMFDRVGHSVIKLKRIRTGNLSLGELPEGAFRHLTGEEVKSLRDAAQRQGIDRPEPRPVPLAAQEARKPSPALVKRIPETADMSAIARKRDARRPKPSYKGSRPDSRPWKVRTGAGAGKPSDTDRRSRAPYSDRKARASAQGTRFERKYDARSPKPFHKGSKPDARPWKARAEAGAGRPSDAAGRSRTPLLGRKPRESQQGPGSARKYDARGSRPAHPGSKPDQRPWKKRADSGFKKPSSGAAAQRDAAPHASKRFDRGPGKAGGPAPGRRGALPRTKTGKFRHGGR